MAEEGQEGQETPPPPPHPNLAGVSLKGYRSVVVEMETSTFGVLMQENKIFIS